MSFLFYPLSVFFAIVLVVNTNAMSAEDASLSEFKSAEQRTDTLMKEILEVVTLGFYEGASKKEQTITDKEIANYERASRARIAAFAVCGLAAAFLLLVGFQERLSGRSGRRRVTVHVLGIAAIFLAIGLSTPILTVVAQSQVAVLGDVVLQFESKGIFSTCVALFEREEWFIALLLLLFSMVIPVLKIVVSFGVLIVPGKAQRRRFERLLRHVGKWSMTDVFVVGVLLAFFAADAGKLTDADIEAGLYFFAGYALLSLLATQILIAESRADTDSDKPA